jgi:translation initiation factor IF-2
MAEQGNDGGKKVLSLAGRGTLKLDAKADVVRQSFSHGRSKAVAVEVKKKRAPGEVTGQPVSSSPRVNTARSGATEHLTDGEREARARALKALREDAVKAPAALSSQPSIAELNRPAPPPPPPVAPPAAVKPTDREALRRQEMEELKRIKEAERQAATMAELKRQQEENAKRRAEADRQGGGLGERRTPSADTPAGRFTDRPPTGMGGGEEEDRRGVRRTRGAMPATRTPAGKGTGDRWGKANVDAALSDEDGVRRRSIASIRRRAERARQMAQMQSPKEKIAREIVLPEVITVQELANRMAERGADVIKVLMKMGMLVTITQTIDADTAELVAGELGHKVKRVTEADVLEGLGGVEDEAGLLQPRPPVVTIMGHVDHGKTSLLDAIRKTNVVKGEAGGITQHIGAYQVELPGRGRVTFIDTPGHAAFSEMRARGANVTDIVVLVVAADDSIMPQTIEAISHAKAAGVPIVVAINKCDLPAANAQRVRTDLLQHELVVEQMGGEVLDVEVSAKTGKNLDKLLETILLQAEVLDLKANPDRSGQGTVVEARLEKGRGSVATVLVQKGTIRVGDIFVAGSEWGRVRALLNDHGENVQSAGPAAPVEVLGFQGTPQAGDDLVVVENEARAREVADYRDRKRREVAAAASARGSLDQMFAQIKAGEVKELPVVIKGDVHGSIEAIATSLEKLTADNAEVKVRVLHSAVGAITESDVILANATKALIIGFNVRANPQARDMARRDGLEIRYYSIIYQVIDDVKAALTGLLSPTLRENFIGHAEIREVFNITGVGKVAGCMVTDGMVKRGAGVRLLRDNVVIHTGTLKTLKRFKDEVKEVKEGFECGMAFEKYDDIKTGDIIEAYEVEEVARELA